MAEILGLGCTHWPTLCLPNERLTDVFNRVLDAPNVDPSRKDPVNWPSELLAELGNDNGLSAAQPLRRAVRQGFPRAAQDPRRFQPGFRAGLGRRPVREFQGGHRPAVLHSRLRRQIRSAALGRRNGSAGVGKPNRWGEKGDWTLPLKGHREAAKYIATGLIERGIDLAYAYKPLHHPMAHAFTNTFLYLDWDRQGFPYPVVPFAINCYGSNLIHAKGGFGTSVRPAAAGRRGGRPAVAASLARYGCRGRDRRGAGALAVPGRADRLVVVVALLPVAEKRLSVAGSRGRPHPVRRAGARRLGDLAQALAGRHGIFRAARNAELDGARPARWRRSTGSRSSRTTWRPTSWPRINASCRSRHETGIHALVEKGKQMEPIVGSGNYRYRVHEDWQLPPEWLDVKACAVSVELAGPGVLLQS